MILSKQSWLYHLHNVALINCIDCVNIIFGCQGQTSSYFINSNAVHLCNAALE